MRLRQVFLFGIGLFTPLTGGFHVCEAGTKELIKNGKFEKSNLAKWRIESSDPSVAWFFPDRVGSTSPLNLFRTSNNRRGGKNYAIADQVDSSYVLMRQKFRIPRRARTVILNYQMFADSLDPVIQLQNAFNLDKPNQQARVDLLKGGARSRELKGGVVRKIYTRGADTVEAPQAPRYRRYRINLTPDVEPGRSYWLRFSVTATEDEFLLGVDNVSIKAR